MKAAAEPAFRFHAVWDKVCRQDGSLSSDPLECFPSKVLAENKPVTGETMHDTLLQIRKFQGLIPPARRSTSTSCATARMRR
jgi:hypothetical protein